MKIKITEPGLYTVAPGHVDVHGASKPVIHQSGGSIIDPDHLAAARWYLTAEAAARYAHGDMTVTDEIGHEAIAVRAAEDTLS